MAKSTKRIRVPPFFCEVNPFVRPAANVRIPDEALSARIWAVLDPILATRTTPPPLAELRVVVNLVVGVWNAYFMSLPPWNRPEHLAGMRKSLDENMGGPGHGDALLATILDVVKTRFSDECRLIGQFTVAEGANGAQVISCSALLHNSLLAK